jgi:hypothetical protein
MYGEELLLCHGVALSPRARANKLERALRSAMTVKRNMLCVPFIAEAARGVTAHQ